MTADSQSPFKLPIAVLVSGNGSNLQAIIDASTDHSTLLPVDIRVVISNRKDAYALQRAQKAHIPTAVISNDDYCSREQYDAALQAKLDQYQPGLIVLAGFLRILSDKFVTHNQGRIINIHPSLLPKYRGLNTHQRAIDAGDIFHGASVHYVTPKLDEGPVIVQAQVPIFNNDTAKTLANRVHQAEHLIYPLALGWIAKSRLQWKQDGIYFDSQLQKWPINFRLDVTNNTLLPEQG